MGNGCRREVAAQVTRLSVVAVLFLLGGAVAWAGTPVNWVGGTGNWSEDDNWDPVGVPNNNGQTYDVAIAGLADDVSLDMSVTVDTVDNAGTLRLLDGFSLSLAMPAGITNSGTFSVNHEGSSTLDGRFNNSGFAWVEAGDLQLWQDVNNSSTMWLGDGSFLGSDASLTLRDDLAFTGAGELYFNCFAFEPVARPTISISEGAVFTNSVDHRIHGGAGRITGEGRLENFGLIDADVPLRPLTIDAREFYNAGDLVARSGNLDVTVDNWTNEGVVRVAQNSISQLNSTLITNLGSGAIESVGGADLEINSDLDTSGTLMAAGNGTMRFTRSSGVISNLPGGRIEANSGTVRFDGNSLRLNNFGNLSADAGRFEFARSTTIFGGYLDLTNGSRLEQVADSSATSYITQVRTTLDSTSGLGLDNTSSFSQTLNHDGILYNNGGTLYADADVTGNSTFNLYGEVFGDGGTIRADGGRFYVSNATWIESGAPALDIRNGGSIEFSNVDSSIPTLDVSWAGTGGSMRFSNYRGLDVVTALDLADWTATEGTLTVDGNTVLVASGRTSLPAGTTLQVSGTGTWFDFGSLMDVPQGALVDLYSAGTLSTGDLSVSGELLMRWGTLDGDVTINPDGIFTLQSSSNFITGDFTWSGDRVVEPINDSTSLGVDGTFTVPAGSEVRLFPNGARLNGAGTLVNSGTLTGAARSNNNATYVDIDLENTVAGLVRAAQNNEAINTSMYFYGNVNNAGAFEVDGAQMRFSGADVTNSGTIQAMDNPANSQIYFQNASTMVDAGGALSLNGLGSYLEISAASDVEVNSFSLSGGATATVTGTDSVLTALQPITVPADSMLSLLSYGALETPTVELDGVLRMQSYGRVEGDVNVNPGGQILVGSSFADLNGTVNLANDGQGGVGRLSLIDGSSLYVTGTGVIINDGLIEFTSPGNNQSNYLQKDVVNNPDGVIRSYNNGSPGLTNAYLQSNIDNQGLIEADGTRVRFSNATVTNSGSLSAVDHALGSELYFENNTTVVNNGGTTAVDGPLSFLQVSTATVDLGQVSFTNGAHGDITGATSTLTGTVTVDELSSLEVRSSGVLAGPSTEVAGLIEVGGSARVTAPLTILPTGELINFNNSSTGYLDGPVEIQRNGEDYGRMAMAASSARFDGEGLITNHGLIESAPTGNSQITYLDSDVLNEADGIIRGSQTGGLTNTRLYATGAIDNLGTIEAIGAEIQFAGASVNNQNMIQVLDDPVGSKLNVFSSTTITDNGGSILIDGANSQVEISGGSTVEASNFLLTNGAQGVFHDSTTQINADLTIDEGSYLRMYNSVRVGGSGLQVDGELNAQSSSRALSPVTVGSTGLVTLDNSYFYVDDSITVETDGQGGDGRLSILDNGARLAGEGTLTNHGLVEGGASSNNGTTYLDIASTFNAAEGVIRAFSNEGATGTHFQINRPVNNAGLMEADAAELYFNNTTVDNAGEMRAVNGGQLGFYAGTVVNNTGGSIAVDEGALAWIDGSTTRVDSASFQVDGSLTMRNRATLLASTTISPTGTLFMEDASDTVYIDGPLSILRDQDSAGRLAILNNSSSVSGVGLITNSGLIEGGATSNNNTTYLYNNVVNEADGVIRAFSNGGATGTYFDLRGSIDNAGLMVADSAQLQLNTGSVVTNSGTMQALAESLLSFRAGAQVMDAGGTIEVDPLGEVLITDNGTWVDSTINVAGTLRMWNNGRAAGTVNLLTGGQLVANSGTAYLDGPVFVTGDGGENYGTLSIEASSARVAGTGLITNDGLIQGVGVGSSYTTYIENDILNNPNGVLQAVPGGEFTDSRLFLYGNVDNAGTIEADGAWLRFAAGSSVTNSGVIRAVENATSSSELRFEGGLVIDAGGSTLVDGAMSELYVDSGTIADLGMLSLTNGGFGQVSGSTTRLTSQLTVDEVSTMEVTGSSWLRGTAQVDGTMYLRGSGRLDATTTVGLTGSLVLDSSTGYLDEALTIAGDGESSGHLSLLASGATMNGLGDIENFGVVEGGSISDSGSTSIYNELINRDTGVVRAFSNEGATDTSLYLYGNVTNEGRLEADAARLHFNNTFVDNAAGEWAALNGGRLVVSGSFVGGSSGSTTTIDGVGSTLEVLSGSLVGFDFLTLTNGGSVQVSGSGSNLAILNPFDVPLDSTATVSGSGRLQADMTVGGLLLGQGGEVRGNVTVQDGGVLRSSGSNTYVDGDILVQSGGLVEMVESSGAIRHEGLLTNQVGGEVVLDSNTTALYGTGEFRNEGTLRGGAWSDSNTVTLSKELNNLGSVVAESMNGALDTRFYINSSYVENSGSITATQADLEFYGSEIRHSGTMLVENDHTLRFNGGAELTGDPTAMPGLALLSPGLSLQASPDVVLLQTGGITVDGDGSLLEVTGSSNVLVAGVTLTNGGDINLAGGGRLESESTLDISGSSLLTVHGGNASIDAPSINVASVMDAGYGTIEAPVEITSTGQLNLLSGSGATFEDTLHVANDGMGGFGRVSFQVDGATLDGAGTLINDGLIEASVPNDNNYAYVYHNLVNGPDGVVRAYQNGEAINTGLYLQGTMTNNGVMEADGGNLYFASSTLQNNNVIRALDHADGSRLIFTSSSQVTGGDITLNGPASQLEVGSSAQVTGVNVSLSGGAMGTLSGSSSVLNGAFDIDAGSTFTVSSGTLQVVGAGMMLDGDLIVNHHIQASAAVVAGAGSSIDLSSGSTLDFDDDLTIDGDLILGTRTVYVDGVLNFGPGSTFSSENGSRLRLDDDLEIESTQQFLFSSMMTDLSLTDSFNMGDPQSIEVASEDVGNADLTGFVDNFAWRSLVLEGSDQYAILNDAFDNIGDGAGNEALYVSTLTFNDLDSRLVLNGYNLYYQYLNGDLSQIDTSLGGMFFQLPTAAPEPSSVVLLVLGGAVLLKRKRSA
jgi:hypothetical protein